MKNLEGQAHIKALNDCLDTLYKFNTILIYLDKEQKFTLDCYNELSTRIQDKINEYKKSIQDLKV
jgi:hypothetical protein